MEQAVKNRGWVKNVAIVFLAILLVLTFFSNTWMNRSLPEVATQGVTSGPITARVRGTGTVEANGSYELKAESTRKISAVMVRTGQMVNAGDVMFILGEGDSAELEAANENLRQLQMSYQQTAVGMPSFDYTREEKAIEEAQAAEDAAWAELQRALQELSDLGTDMEQYESSLRAAEAKLNKARADLETAKAGQAERHQQLWDVIARDQILLRFLESAETALTGAEEPIGSLPLDPLDYEKLSESEKALVDEELKQLNEALSSCADAAGQLDSVKLHIEKYKQEAQNAELQLGAEDPEIGRANEAVIQAQAELDALLQALGPYAESYTNAKNSYETAQSNRETLEYNLMLQRVSDNKSAASAAMSLQEINYQIEKAKKLVEELSGGEENQILAPVSGIIESVLYTAGNTAPKGEVLSVIQVPDLGYTLSFSVTNDQARRLRTGDTATVTNYYWGSQINATLDSIRTDPRNPQTSKLLTFTVTGDVNPGSQLTIAVGEKSQNYDVIVPNSAIRSDSNGSFVLAVEARNSPLGNRYYAKRVEVTVLASDDVNSAVSAELGWGDFVITTSNKPIKAGDMVRMPD